MLTIAHFRSRRPVMVRLTLLLVMLVAADEPKADPARKARPDGTWRVVSMERDGVKVPEAEAGRFRLTLAGDRYVLRAEDQTMDRGAIRYDLKAQPATVDVTPLEGEHKGKTFQGVYDLKGDRLTMCLAVPGKARPADLTAPAGSGRFTVIYQRDKP
jgi:uncharacterized protein (TIGR03067 family)